MNPTCQHISFADKSERAFIRKTRGPVYICKGCGEKRHRHEPRPTHDPQGYKHTWEEYYLPDAHHTTLQAVKDVYGNTLYIPIDHPRTRFIPIYSKGGIATGDMLHPANISTTP